MQYIYFYIPCITKIFLKKDELSLFLVVPSPNYFRFREAGSLQNSNQVIEYLVVTVVNII